MTMKTVESKTTQTAAQTAYKAPSSLFFSKEQQGATPFFSTKTIQRKLKIGQPNDAYEQQVDAVADHVVKTINSPVPSVQTKCAACEQEEKLQKKEEDISPIDNKLQTKPIFESAGDAPSEDVLQRQTDNYTEGIASADLSSRLSASKGGGQALATDTRTSMESAMGADFSNVRVHTGSDAIQMSQDVNAQAFTHGSDVYFNEGKYNPSHTEGSHLLAHELTHTVQQGAAIPSSGGIVQRSCGRVAIGEPADCTDVVGDMARPRYLFKVNCDEFARGNDLDLEKDAENISDKATVDIHGFASVEGDAVYNKHLSCARAVTAKQLVEKVLAKRKVSATIRIFSHGAQAGGRTTMRSVVVNVQNPAPPPPRKVIDCPPPKGFQANSLGDYIDLIKCVETSTSLGNRAVLALLRQMYYGKSWSATSQTDLWDKVIPCNVNPGDPRKLLHEDLFEALNKSVNVEGADVGHIFTGLETMMCPSNAVKINDMPIVSSIMDDIANVNMTNEQFATWGGDLGAAVAAFAACWFMDDTERASTDDCKGADLMQGLLGFLQIHAPDEDLEGDILPFALRANANGVACSGSMGQKLNLTALISQLFLNFMASQDATGNVNRYACFTEIIGGQIVGGQIQNKDTLVATYSEPVMEFAKTYYVKIMTDVHGKYPPHRSMPFGNTILLMQKNTPWAIRYFLAWLERHLTAVP